MERELKIQLTYYKSMDGLIIQQVLEPSGFPKNLILKKNEYLFDLVDPVFEYDFRFSFIACLPLYSALQREVVSDINTDSN